MKRYSHPEHGFHVSADAEAMLKNGWTECGWEVSKGGDPVVVQEIADEAEPFDPDPEGEEPGELPIETAELMRPTLSLPKRK